MTRSDNACPPRPRGKIVWKAIDHPGQFWSATSVADLHRRIRIRNDLLRNIEASRRLTSSQD
ncbi:hypothetical protein TA3x_004780 [Tundrisphaera sp. TA3]|uniref:hypothetical protein n=1 Tax=Tundrisphaera sp. TA3 TaxID=3435775 RepID=UPI003EB8809D